MCNVLLPQGVNSIAFKKYIISYHIIYHIITYDFRQSFSFSLLTIGEFLRLILRLFYLNRQPITLLIAVRWHVCWSVLRDTAKYHAETKVRCEIKFLLQWVRHHNVWVLTHCYGSFSGEICKENEASSKTAFLGKKKKFRPLFWWKNRKENTTWKTQSIEGGITKRA
jgi:hypothetical protein